ncbi:MAG: ATP-dependent helicase [Glaciimonas sp.]|nr:ATP-dependent helicase [Glaciimonas sp.]
MIQIDSDSILPNIDVNFRVSAGPGAGKTYWLVQHLKSVLRDSTRLGKSGKVSCITYTNIGADTIMSRLGPSADRVEVSSIHRFLYKNIVRPYLSFVAEEFGVNIERVDGHTDSILSNYTFLNEWKTQSKQNRITDDQEIVKAFKDLRWKFDANGELLVNTSYPHKIDGYAIKKASYLLYKRLAWGHGVLHHDDVLFLSYQILLKFPFVLSALVARFPYFFVDEFQDSNPIQVSIIKMLGQRGAFIGIIGDIAQSIYGFQGAEPQQFQEFTLPGLIDYIMSGNRRSSNQIVDLLNLTRKDITQVAHRKVDLALPRIFVGHSNAAYQAAKLLCQPQAVHSLSRDNLTSNVMRRELGAGVFDRRLIPALLIADSNDARRSFVIACIKSVELARQCNFKDAIKELRKGLRRNPSYKEEDRVAIKLIMRLLAGYAEFSKMTLLDFSHYLRSTFAVDTSKVTAGKTKIFYEKTSYQEIALCVNIGEDLSLHKTVHKAKGDEFDNVLIVLPDSSRFDFILSPDLLSSKEKSEEQRVNYVGISRAKNRLFICVPELSSEYRISLGNYFDIEDL